MPRLLYRISRQQYAGDLSGEGGRRALGRWHQQGWAVVYAATSEALATLETLVHSPLHLAPKGRALTIYQAPEELSCRRIQLEELPADWFQYPAGAATQRIGTQWLESRQTVLLEVPSAVTPHGHDWNLLINPAHPEARQISVAEIIPYDYDARLFKR